MIARNGNSILEAQPLTLQVGKLGPREERSHLYLVRQSKDRKFGFLTSRLLDIPKCSSRAGKM